VRLLDAIPLGHTRPYRALLLVFVLEDIAAMHLGASGVHRLVALGLFLATIAVDWTTRPAAT
jgi:hypothetical protein